MKKNDTLQFKVLSEDDWTTAVVFGRRGKATGGESTWYSIRVQEGDAERDISVDLPAVDK